MRRLRNQALVPAFGFAILAGVAACSGTGAEAPAAADETARTVPVRTARVETRDMAEMLALTGTLDARAEVFLAQKQRVGGRTRVDHEGSVTLEGMSGSEGPAWCPF